jgi:transposase
MNTKLHAVGDALGRPVRLHLTEGQRSDFKGADVLLPDLPDTKTLIADRGYDSKKVRKIIEDQDVAACIPPKKNRKEQIAYCETTYKKRHKVENLFAKLKDWRRIAMRYDRCVHTFKSAIYIAAIVIFWL